MIEVEPLKMPEQLIISMVTFIAQLTFEPSKNMFLKKYCDLKLRGRLSWSLMFPFELPTLPQNWHLNGFSPV